jgi:Uma2 family endonuclease
MTVPVKARVSEEEYLATMTGEKPSLEFVNGEVFQKPMTKKDHQDVSKRIVALMYELERRKLGYFAWETTTNLSEGSDRRYRVPDIAFWAGDRPVAQPDDVYLPPTLAIEVRSQGQSLRDLREKCREYRSRGVDVCWLVDPGRKTVEVFEGDREGVQLEGGATLATAKVPGFSMPVAELWVER